MDYLPNESRFASMQYNRCGRSGFKLPAISLGLWHNFGGVDVFENSRAMALHAFDLGITHFDLANNYGPPPGSAEETFGRIFRKDLRAYRDELLLSSKAGYLMSWPYGEWGSRKYLVASIDQSLRRMGLDYLDIFYHHRPDPETPLEETMRALDYIVRSGRALYIGLSNYPPDKTRQACKLLHELGTPCLIHQPTYSMFNRWIEDHLLDVLREEGMGCIVLSPLAQGLLTDMHVGGSTGGGPEDTRVARSYVTAGSDRITEDKLAKIRRLNDVAKTRSQTLPQMALAWVWRHPIITAALIGPSQITQIDDAVGALKNMSFSAEELQAIESILEE